MTPYELHQAVKKGNLQHVGELLNAAHPEFDINEWDPEGWTPLMYAVAVREASIELVSILLQHGASIDQADILPIALHTGDPGKVALLIEAGADIRYCDENGYDALIDAVHGRDVLHDSRFIELLKLLIANGVSMTGRSKDGESGVRVLSRIGSSRPVENRAVRCYPTLA